MTPSNMPGSMMSQNKAVPAHRITNRLSTAPIAAPASRPTAIERSFWLTYPIATPASKPFSSEEVMTPVITGARDGSRNPLRPSSSPSVPPTASPSIGFVRLMAFPCLRAVCFRAPAVTAVSFRATSLRIWVHVHHAEKIAFRVFAICEVAHARNRCFRHDVFSAGLLRRVHRCVNRLNADGVGGRGNAARLFHHAAVYARCSFRSGCHHPVLGGTGPLIELPAKYSSIERRGAIRIRCGYFKMNDSRHSSPSLDLRAKLLLFLWSLLARGCGRCWDCAKLLRRVTHDQTYDASRQYDLEVVVFVCNGIGHCRDGKRQQRAD